MDYSEAVRENLGQEQDDLLSSRAQNGDREAFGELYRRYLAPILRFVSFRVASKEDAEDLVGLVFCRAWKALPRYRERELGFRAWLYRIARNAVIDYYRTSRRQVSLDSERALSISSHDDSDTSLSVYEMREALGQLPEEQQTVLILRFVEGLSHTEVSQALGKSEGACRMIQLRALQALAREMDEQR